MGKLKAHIEAALRLVHTRHGSTLTVHSCFCSTTFHSHADNSVYFSSKMNSHCPSGNSSKPFLPLLSRFLLVCDTQNPTLASSPQTHKARNSFSDQSPVQLTRIAPCSHTKHGVKTLKGRSSFCVQCETGLNHAVVVR